MVALKDPNWTIGRISHRLLQGNAFLIRLVTHPSWAMASLRVLLDKRSDARHETPLKDFPVSTLEDAILRVTRFDIAEVKATLAEAPTPRLQRESVLYDNPDGSGELVALTYTLCRLLQPELIVETGVANGFTSAAILEALDQNDRGTLESVDLPHLHPRARESVGSAVKNSHHGRWQLHFGPAEKVLTRMLSNGLKVDIFVQDAAHTSRGQREECKLGWKALRSGGILISDDADGGFATFVDEIGGDAVYVAQGKDAPIAMVKKI